MNLLGLKSEVSREMEKLPSTLGRSNIMLYGFASYISNAPKELSWTPEMSFSKVSSQPLMLFKDSISRITLKQLQSSSNAHRIRNLNKKMYMIRLNTKLINLKSVLGSNFLKNLFTKFSKLREFEWVFGIFRLPHKVEGILTSRMSKFTYFHFFSSYAKFKNIAHSIMNRICECANSITHFFYSFKNLRRFGLPRAEALGILYM